MLRHGSDLSDRAQIIALRLLTINQCARQHGGGVFVSA